MIYLINSKLEHHIGEWFKPECIVDIAFRLSHINRFGGAVGSYSVAQHSLLVALHLPDEFKLAGLLHDVSEAYIGDVTSPLKQHIEKYDELEDFYGDVIDKHWGVDIRHPWVKEADYRMLVTEAKSFGMPLGYFDLEPYDFTIQRMTAEEAAFQFVALYKELRDGTII